MATATPAAKLELKPPPYPLDALEPHMSANTMSYHWGKHHRSYVDNLNKQILGTELQGKSLEDVIVQTYNNGDLHPAFNNAAQVWNHDFFWDSMKPGGGGKPSGELLKLIERDFGSFEKFAEEFRAAAATQFGSGWAWLAFNPRPSDGKELVVLKTPNAVNPLVLGYTALLTIDVWEVRKLTDGLITYQSSWRSSFPGTQLALSLRLPRRKLLKTRRGRREKEWY
ncbi:hypothetical protein ACJRO7_006020 [Eucalyptus globulus]